MKLAIMQPYLFPYIGYFQLISQAEKFVVYDDVHFIKQGWINRNRILLNGKDHLFTVPLTDASSYKLIRETALDPRSFPKWREKFYKTLEQAYKKAPYYTNAISLISLALDKPCDTISTLAVNSILAICDYLDVQTNIVKTAIHYNNSHLSAEERVIDICLQEKASVYVNPTGGTELYSKVNFEKHGMLLQFIRSGSIVYPQFRNEFIPWLSIIDVLMFNDKNTIKQFLSNYTLE